MIINSINDINCADNVSIIMIHNIDRNCVEIVIIRHTFLDCGWKQELTCKLHTEPGPSGLGIEPRTFFWLGDSATHRAAQVLAEF